MSALEIMIETTDQDQPRPTGHFRVGDVFIKSG